MIPYSCKTTSQLEEDYIRELAAFEACKKQGLRLNIARGKPSKAQLDLVSEILAVIQSGEECIDGNVDTRNYGEPAGLPSARAYWADILGCRPEQTFVGGCASLKLMYDVIALAYSHGLPHSNQPWCREEKVKFLCPSPGYDRHFRITEFFGAELITVPMLETGPDMDMVERLVKDPQVKGIWCVPKYSNPDGIIYSNETIRRFAAMCPAAPDFLVMWDNAYCVHEFSGEYVPFPDLLSLCHGREMEDHVVEFASTSKITFAGGGMSVMAASEKNIAFFTRAFGVQMICHDKVNQLRHVRFLKDKAHTLELMKRHGQILAPKFQLVLDRLEEQVAPLGFAQWHTPTGGYFISLNTMPGTAKRALALCAEAGLTMTPAGASFPYGIDPKDSNIRIAPSLPPLEELDVALQVFTTCLRLAALEKLLGKISSER